MAFAEDIAPFFADEVFGEAATYTDRNSVSVPCMVIVDADLSRYGEAAAVNQRTAVLLVQADELTGLPRRGETFTIAATGKVWRVDSVQASDDRVHQVFVA